MSRVKWSVDVIRLSPLPKALVPSFDRRASMRSFAVFLVLIVAMTAWPAEPAIRLREIFPVDYQYHVSCRVDLTGQLTLPPESKDAAPATVDVRGTSAIEYDERVLESTTSDKPAPRTLRIYRRVELKRTLGDKPQETTIRPSVRRLVILRHGHREVPFSPDGPLLWSEIDLVRTDVFTPALATLLPEKAVAVGDRWPAGAAAIEELTDIDKVEEGGLECRFDEITTLAGRRFARIRFSGTVRGINDDGPNKQTLDGYFYFDLGSNHLSYLSLEGTNFLLDKDGHTTGKVKGQFVLTRQINAQSPDLSDAVVRKLTVEPNAENTQLLYENAELGVRFQYPRRWHVGEIRGRQVTLDEPAGNGILISLEDLAHTPSAANYLTESREFFAKQKSEILAVDAPRRLSGPPDELDQFGLEAKIAGQTVHMDYFVVRQPGGGALVAARLLPRDLAAVRSDVERIVRSMRVGK